MTIKDQNHESLVRQVIPLAGDAVLRGNFESKSGIVFRVSHDDNERIVTFTEDVHTLPHESSFEFLTHGGGTKMT